MRKFLEAENAVFDLDALLTAVQRGTVTQVQVEALRRAHAPVYTKIASYMLEDPDKLQKLERAKLKTVEMILGAPLTPGADPAYVLRQQEVFAMAAQASAAQGQSPTQALKIPGAGKPPSEYPHVPSAKPTQSQRPGPRQLR
jgi:hypothetical protein